MYCPLTGSTLVNLPLDPALPAGDYFLIVQTDVFQDQPETDESNNVAVTTETISLDFPPLPDLQVENLVVPATATAGQIVTATWQTVNNGAAAVESSLSERIVVVNLSTGATLLSQTIGLDVPVGEPIEIVFHKIAEPNKPR